MTPLTVAPATSVTSATITEAPARVFVLSATLQQPFIEELNDRTSQQFRNLEATVVTACDLIYRTRFGLFFVRTFVIFFRPGPAVTRISTTEVEVGIEFNQTAPAAEIPRAEDVAKTLVDAVNNPNSTFNLSIDATSVTVIQINMTSNSTTAPPTLNTTANASMSTATRTPPTTTIAVVPTSPAAVTSEAVTTRRLTFRSAGETFTTDLLNPSSAAFQRRASLITSTLVPFYQRAFTAFRTLTVTSFRNGSIINNMDITFASASVPNGTQIGNVLIQAASTITAFNVDLNSIVVDGSQVSSGVSHKISLITASFLVLSSWILSNQQ
uniref:interphotoreceptor matrix proteoglycan 2-like isoform X3 n=1 Tax=Gasterosteus aculeatus aculeatus TaxID=481459 RepID=UPI001A99BC8F|nr:interphotoreceptor matrix proteoglycan 2-like isoform X3 [Gasterosteus aculeatus aculeatus]XP_040037498.1 interphotoreceptor matrix proteoglycan 2-like isoform X4 [Gasterosteus aculeatus aculeatus]